MYFGLPSYADRLKLWKTKVKEKISYTNNEKMKEAQRIKDSFEDPNNLLKFNSDYGSLDNSLDYAVLAEMSNGYSQESIIAAIDYTLTRQRLEKIKLEPLDAKEFITTLSRTQYLYAEDYDEQRKFLNVASGFEDYTKFLAEKAEENEKNNKK